MNDKKNIVLGYLSALGFVLVTIISLLFIEKILVTFPDQFLAIFCAMLISTVFFHLLNMKKLKAVYCNVVTDFSDYLKLSLLVGLNWLCSIFGVIKSNIFVYNLFYFMVSLCLAHVVSYVTNKKLGYLVLAFLIGTILLFALINNVHLFLGIMIAVGGGTAAYLYRKTVVSFAKKTNLTSTQILMTRFLPFLIFLGYKSHFYYLGQLLMFHSVTLLVFAFVSLVVPTFLNQYSILKIGAEQSIMVSAAIFPLSWLFESLVSDDFKLGSNLIIAMCASIILVAPYLRVVRRYLK